MQFYSFCRRAALFLVFFCLFISFTVVPCLHAGTPPYPGLTKVVDNALGDPGLKHGIKGVFIKSLDTAKILYEKNSDVLLLPASNLKLLVSSAALDTLGPDFRFRTSLYMTAKPDLHGLLKGSLVLVGGGDPVLKHEHLQAMVDKLKEIGVRTIEGDVIGDDSRFDDVRLGWGWSWDEEPYYYAAQISALNLNENVVDVWVRPGKKSGDQALVKLSPLTGYLVVRNECKTTGPETSKALLVDRARGRNTIRVSGTVPSDYKPEKPEESITVEDPAIFTCHTFIEMLRRSGIEVMGQAVHGTKPESAELVAAYDSPSLSQVLALLNKPSDNLIAECLLKTLGAQAKGKGTSESGTEVEINFLKKIGADISAVAIIDGSGLSRKNLVSPRNLVTILSYMYRHKDSKVFIDSLPVAGVDGTLKKRMKGTSAEGNVKAKTGYVNRVSTVSGYVTTKGGDHLVFSILLNNHLCSNKEAIEVQDRVLEALANLGN